MSNKNHVVAIDGPAGAGKSTVSKTVARKLGYLYIDTGAMYRSIALKALRFGIGFDKETEITDMAKDTKLDLKPSNDPAKLIEIFLDGEDVSAKIRTEEVSQGASKVSAISGVRKVLQEKQRELGAVSNVVMEGRDIGTAVFPDADFKFYLDASVEERAMRRFKELKAKGSTLTLKEIENEISIRDDRDKNRKADPLTRAPDAMYIDSTGLSIEGSADVLIDLINSKIKKDEDAAKPQNSGIGARMEADKTYWLFYVGKFMFWLLFKIFWRCTIHGHENIPKEGGILIAPNHMNFADPPLVGSSMSRPLYFMAKQELFDTPILGFLIKRTHAFPVRRGQQDVGAFRTAQKLLEYGKPVLVFPEGTRSKDGNFGKARAGAGMLACHAQVPVVPVRLMHTNLLSKFHKIKVIFGKPIYPPKDFVKDDYLLFSQRILEEIKKLS